MRNQSPPPPRSCFFAAVGLLMLASCNDAMLLKEADEKFAVEIRYEQKVVSYHEMDNPTDVENLSDALKMSLIPVETREKVRIGVYKDGRSNWEITRLEADNPDLPTWKSKDEAKTIRCFDDKTMFFDADGRFISEMKTPTPRFDALLESLRGDKANRHILGMGHLKTTGDDIQIVDRFESKVVIRNTFTDEVFGKLTEYNTIDTVSGLNYVGKLYDAEGNLMSGTQLFYDEINETLTVPIGELQQVYEQTHEGLPYTIHIITEYTDYLFINNLNQQL